MLQPAAVWGEGGGVEAEAGEAHPPRGQAGAGQDCPGGGMARALGIPPEKGTGGARSVAWAAGRKRV